MESRKQGRNILQELQKAIVRNPFLSSARCRSLGLALFLGAAEAIGDWHCWVGQGYDF